MAPVVTLMLLMNQVGWFPATQVHRPRKYSKVHFAPQVLYQPLSVLSLMLRDTKWKIFYNPGTEKMSKEPLKLKNITNVQLVLA